MKTGSQTASLVNHLYSRMTSGQPDPVVGMGVTLLCWTDRKPGTIRRVFNIGKALAIEVTEDDATRVDGNGMSESQTYAFTPRPDAYRSTYRQTADGKWRLAHFDRDTKRWSNGSRFLRLGERECYHDFSF